MKCPLSSQLTSWTFSRKLEAYVFFPLSFARKQAFIQSLKQRKILQRMLLGRLQTSHTLWPYLTRLWHDTKKDQSAIRPMTSLNNFYLRDQYPKPWCVWRPLNTSKVESKLLSCLTLESNAYQIHLDILFLSWCTLKGQSRLRSHLSPFLSRIQGTGKVMTYLIHTVWHSSKLGSKLCSYLTSP